MAGHTGTVKQGDKTLKPGKKQQDVGDTLQTTVKVVFLPIQHGIKPKCVYICSSKI